MSDDDLSLRATLDQLASFLFRNEVGDEEKTSTCLPVADDTWDCYGKLRQVYSLEGDQTQWLVCLLYLTNEKQLTINKKELKSTLNRFSFDFLKFMRFTKDSLAALFAKMNKVIEMINMPRELCAQIELVERNFNVSCILFAKFKQIFSKTFKNDHTFSGSAASKDLFEIAWLLFIYVKEKFPHIGSDLVNSFQLLVCCLNLIYVNLAHDAKTQAGIIDFLCKEYEIKALEVKTIYEHYFKPQVRLMGTLKIFSDFADYERLEGLIVADQLGPIRQRLFEAYETLLTDSKETSPPRVGAFELDERIFLNSPDTGEMAEEADKSHSRRSRVILPDCLASLYRLSELAKHRCEEPCRERLVKTCPVLGELNFEAEIIGFIDQTIETRLSQAVKSAILAQLTATNKVPVDQKDHLAAIDELMELVKCLYYALLDKLLDSERCLQLSLHGPSNCDSLLKLLVESEPFHKSLFACCFETVSKFSTVFWAPASEKRDPSSAQIRLAADKSFEFPWIIGPLELKVFDLFRIIEMFVKTLTQSSVTPPSQQQQQVDAAAPTTSLQLQLNRDMVKHLSSCEEKILETLAWQRDSSVWQALSRVRLRQQSELQSAESRAGFQRTVAFPFYEDVQAVPARAPSSGGGGHGSSDLVLNITPNPVSSPASVHASSPIKPMITRVVCSGPPPPQQQSKITIASRNFPKPAAEVLPKPAKSAARLEHLASPLSYLFRKFYLLANARMRAIVDRIDLNSISKFDSSTRTSFDYSLASMTPVTPAASAIIAPTLTTRSLSAIPLSSNIIPPSSHTVNAEQLDLLFRKAWNIFEYSISSGSASLETDEGVRQNLMCDRHLDQMILCAIYVTCKVTCMPVPFQELMRLYRCSSATATTLLNNNNNSHVYRSVLVDAESKGDIIQFYNQVYIKKVRSFALHLSVSSSALAPPGSSKTQQPALSPAPKVHISSVHTQFSPRKIVENHLVFVSPGKLNTCSSAPIQTAMQRKKLTFTMKDTNPSKSLEMINEMIKTNEAKMKASNKRLFSEVSSSLSNIANGKHYGMASITSISNSSQMTNRLLESKTKKFSPMSFTIRSATSTNLLSSIVNSGSSAKLPMAKSTSSSSLVTPHAANQAPVITKIAATPGTAVRPVLTAVSGASSFARKLLSIQNERSVNNNNNTNK